MDVSASFSIVCLDKLSTVTENVSQDPTVFYMHPADASTSYPVGGDKAAFRYFYVVYWQTESDKRHLHAMQSQWREINCSPLRWGWGLIALCLYFGCLGPDL